MIRPVSLMRLLDAAGPWLTLRELPVVNKEDRTMKWLHVGLLVVIAAAPAQAQEIHVGINGEAWRQIDAHGEEQQIPPRQWKELKRVFLKGVYDGLFIGAVPDVDAYPTLNTSLETLVDALDEFYADPANRVVLVVRALQVLNLKLAGKSDEEVNRAARYQRCVSAELSSLQSADEKRRRLAACRE